MVRRSSRQIGHAVERNEVAEIGVHRIARVGGRERIAPARRQVAVGHAHLVGKADADRELVQSLPEADPLDVVDAAIDPLDLVQVGHHAVRVVPAGPDRQLPRMVAALHVDRKGGRQPHGVVLVGSRTRLIDRAAGHGIIRGQRIEELVAAIRGVEVKLYAEARIAHPEVEKRPLRAVPSVGEVGFGIREEVLRKERHAQIGIDDVFVHRSERIERQRHPAVHVHQVGYLGITLAAEGAALCHGVRPREAHRIEIDYLPAPARRIDQIERQACQFDDRRQGVRRLFRHTVAEPVVGREQHAPPAGRGGIEGSVFRGRDAEFAPFDQIVAMHLVPSRGDRAEIEASAPGPKV